MSITHANRKDDLTSGPLFWRIFRYAIPLMLTGALQMLYNAADLVVVGRFNGEIALAAVGANGALSGLMVNFFMGFSAGAGVCVAHHRGAKEDSEISRVVHTAVSLATLAGIFATVFTLLMAPVLHTWMGTDPLVFDQAVLYLRIFACGMIANLVFNYLASMLRATGNTVVPLIILCVSGLVNVGLNLLLVTQFGMSVDGVAIATVTAQVLSMVAMLIYYVHRKDYLHFSFRKLCLAPDKLKKILRIGIPAGLQSSLFALSNSVIQSGVNSFGATAMAGNAASAQVGNLVYILLNAFYHAAMNFVGQNYAARKFDRVKKTILYCTIFVTVIGVSVSTVILLFGAQAIRIFNSDPAVIEYGLIRLTSVLPVYFLCGIMDSLNGTLRGMGSSTLPMFITLAGSCGLRLVWIWTVFQKIHTLRCLYLCWPISWVVTAVALFCGVVIIYRNRKKEALARDSAPVSA